MQLSAESMPHRAKMQALLAASILIGLFWGASAASEIDPARFSLRAPEHRYLASASEAEPYDYQPVEGPRGYVIRLGYSRTPQLYGEFRAVIPYEPDYSDPVSDVAANSDLGIVYAPEPELADDSACSAPCAPTESVVPSGDSDDEAATIEDDRDI